MVGEYVLLRLLRVSAEVARVKEIYGTIITRRDNETKAERVHVSGFCTRHSVYFHGYILQSAGRY